MSKPDSGHFRGTSGSNNSLKNLSQPTKSRAIILSEDYDTREHPTKYKQMSTKKLKLLREKVQNRTITREEYKRLNWQIRLTARRNKAIKEFWENEKSLIKNGLPTTRNWSAQQTLEILAGRKPKFKGKPMSSHHKYSVTKYPHLANRPELIFAVTIYEHFFGWHGGNTRNSLPGNQSIVFLSFRRCLHGICTRLCMFKD